MTPDTRKILVFTSVEQLCQQLGVSPRRLRQLKEEGRLNYTTDGVLVYQDELLKIKDSQSKYRLAPLNAEGKIRRHR